MIRPLASASEVGSSSVGLRLVQPAFKKGLSLSIERLDGLSSVGLGFHKLGGCLRLNRLALLGEKRPRLERVPTNDLGIASGRPLL